MTLDLEPVRFIDWQGAKVLQLSLSPPISRAFKLLVGIGHLSFHVKLHSMASYLAQGAHGY
jgi:hypothetical protein